MAGRCDTSASWRRRGRRGARRARRRPGAGRAGGAAAGAAGRARGRMARRLRLPAQLRGADALRRPLPLAGAASATCCCGGRRCPTRRRSTASSTRPGEVVGVLVGHTHFDHAVDAPAIARRFGCKAYGSDSLVDLMAPARPRRAGGRGRALPHLRARARSRSASRPASTRSCCSASPSPTTANSPASTSTRSPPAPTAAARSGGSRSRSPGIRFYHQGSANLIDDAVRERGVDVFLAGVAGRSFTDDYWQRILPRLEPARRRPDPLRQLLPPARPARWSSSPTSSSPRCPRRSARSAATSSSPPCPAPTCRA